MSFAIRNGLHNHRDVLILTLLPIFYYVATITYEDPSSAGAAIEWFHDKDFHGHVRILTVTPIHDGLPAYKTIDLFIMVYGLTVGIHSTFNCLQVIKVEMSEQKIYPGGFNSRGRGRGRGGFGGFSDRGGFSARGGRGGFSGGSAPREGDWICERYDILLIVF